MSVHKRTLGSGKVRYEVRWREGETNKSKLFDRKTGEGGADWYDRKIREARQAGDFAEQMTKRRTTVDDLYLDWLERSAPFLTKETGDNYAIQLALRVLPKWRHRRVVSITVAEYERWLGELRADGVRDPTIIKASTVMQALLTLALKDGIVAVNVGRLAAKPRQGRTRIPYLIKPETVETMRAWMVANEKPRDVVLLELLAYLGARPESEAVKLTWQHVRDRSVILVDTKREKERAVPLFGAVRESLDAWRAASGRPGPKQLVTSTTKGGSWTKHDWGNWRSRPFARAAEAAGLPPDVRPRDLRGSLASLLVHEGRNIKQVAEIMGHSPEVCLRDYAQIFEEFDPYAERIDADTMIRRARNAAQEETGS